MQDTVMIVNLQPAAAKKDYSLPFGAGLYHHFFSIQSSRKIKTTLNNFLLSKICWYVNVTLMTASWKNYSIRILSWVSGFITNSILMSGRSLKIALKSCL
jgi:hypothetical protein